MQRPEVFPGLWRHLEKAFQLFTGGVLVAFGAGGKTVLHCTNVDGTSGTDELPGFTVCGSCPTSYAKLQPQPVISPLAGPGQEQDQFCGRVRRTRLNETFSSGNRLRLTEFGLKVWCDAPRALQFERCTHVSKRLKRWFLNALQFVTRIGYSITKLDKWQK
jgi:hypothetical protein